MTQLISDSAEENRIDLRQFPAFKEISTNSEKCLQNNLNIQKFDIGRTLTESCVLPAQIYLLLQGNCRAFIKEQGRLTTLFRLGPGTFIGLASMLRAEPCEDISAATEVVVAAIPDQQIIELYINEISFRRWCDKQLWPVELAALYTHTQKNYPKREESVLGIMNNWIQTAKLTTDEKSFDQHSGRKRFVASANSDIPIGVCLDSESEYPKVRPPFALRIVSLSDELDGQSDNLKSEESLSAIEADVHTEVPQRSNVNIGQKDSLKDFKIIRANGQSDEIIACFQMLSSVLKIPFKRDSIEKILQDNLRRGQPPSIQLLGQIGVSLGLHVVSGAVPASVGTRLSIPCILQWKGEFVVAIKSNITGLTLASPKLGEIQLSKDQLIEDFKDGIVILQLGRTDSTPEQRFGLNWFLPSLIRYRAVLLQVFIASFVVQLFGLANPLLIQIIIDKVISQRSLDTLQVLGFALIIVTILEGVLGSLRTFLFAETTNRIDQRLGAEVIDHLLHLKLQYFDKRPVGELTTRIAELEKIRNFLTGTALTSILDALFSIIYIVVMAFYSWLLTLVALAVLPIQIGITVIGAPLFRRQFRQSAEENAKTQSHLVEVLTGIQTVKAQNVEMVSRWKWQKFYSKYIERTFEKTVTGTALTQTSQILQKLSQLLVLWIGAALVLKGQLTLGQLIAFRIIAGYVTQPLLRLSTIWQNVQELKVSFERLADVIDSPLESNVSDQVNIPLPPIEGNVSIQNLDFSFARTGPQILKNINLNVEKGTFVGIVGQSGSGKSTLMKLIPRLYNPDTGRVLIDGYDIDKVELYSLRRQIGIVPQDPLLFSGTVSENIALTNPEADSEDIVNAARLACAHDFIMELPLGYSTNVGERGSSLSGGQRQRIAIARTLLSRPKLLVLDEATSALDYETERIVCNNLLENLKECTVFFITHRLSSIRKAQKIIMMHQGTIVEQGSHVSLMDKRGRYFALYRQQEV